MNTKKSDELENNENIDNNGCDIRWRDCSGSQEMFSDDEQLKNLPLFSPIVPVKNETLNSSTISLKTPILCSKVTEVTPGKATVPKTPADLQPFITKTSVLWTSDMETPQSKLDEKSESSNKTINSIDINNTTPNRRSCSPTYDKMKTIKMDITSPVLGGKKRSKRKVKRRILNNLGLELDNNNDQQTSISSNSDRVPSEPTSLASNDVAFDIETEVNTSITKECNVISNKEDIKECNPSTITKTTECTILTVKECSTSNKTEFKENKKLEEAVIFDKNSNTSTQDFFSNASFSSIDRLCCSAIQEEKPTPNLDEPKDNKINEVIKKEVNDEEESKTSNVGNDVLERIAAIRRNQKPLKRLSDVNHTVIPKEVFSKSLIELELADAKFNEIKKTENVQRKPLQLKSFQSLSTIENEIFVKKEKSPIQENMSNFSSQLMPADIMDDWHTDIELDNYTDKHKQIDELIDSNANVNFSKANGKKISINEDNLKNRMKIYSEIENEICSTDDFLTLGKSNVKSTLLKEPRNQSKYVGSLSNNVNLKSKNIPINNKLLNTNNDHKERTNEFSTINGRNIAISEGEILDCAKSSKKLENDINKPNRELDFEKNNVLEQKPTIKDEIKENEFSLNNYKNEKDKKAETLKLYQELDLKEFLEPKFTPESTEDVDDGFTTAAGKSIKVNQEKENYYSNIYNDLDDINEGNSLNVKKNKTKFSNKPNDKALLVFDKNETNTVVDDGFSTAAGKSIKVNQEKENYYSNIYNELDDINQGNLLNVKKNRTKFNNKPNDKALLIFDKTETNKVEDDGFSTAAGKSIKVNVEKENYYSNIYNELDDINQGSLLNVKKNKTKFSNKPNDKALLIFDKNETNKVNESPKIFIKEEPDISRTETTNNGFTNSSKGIQNYNDKENVHSKIHSELDNNDENNSLNVKKSQASKDLSEFNKKESNLNNKLPEFPVKKELEISNIVMPTNTVMNDGFSTAGGKDIKINFEKEKYYSNIYNELDDINNEKDFINLKKNISSNTKSNIKISSKPLVAFNRGQNKINLQEKLNKDIRNEKCFLNENKSVLFKVNNNIKPIVTNTEKTGRVASKLSISSDTDEAFYDLGDVEKLLVSSNQAKSENCFTIPDTTNILKKANQTSTVTSSTQNHSSITNKRKHGNAENLFLDEKSTKIIKNDCSLLKSVQEKKLLETESALKNMPNKSQVGIFKQKLENCESKRSERCRSFGGFPVSNEGVTALKLNKSDPLDESVMNQPLQKCLSVSQCFDSHSDSWLSKVELSYLNNSKIKSPDPKIEKNGKHEEVKLTVPSDWKPEVCDEFSGFTYKECTESFRYYTKFKRFLKNERTEYDHDTELNIESGHTISLYNQTSSKQRILVQCKYNVDIKNTSNESNYILVEAKPEIIPIKLPEDREVKAPVEKAKTEKHLEAFGKRKHADTDSDTPLTTLKKPRVGTELQGRKLFSDESDTEENNLNCENSVESAQPGLLPCEGACVLTAQEEEDLSEERLNAVLLQEKIIRNKKRMKVKPVMGSMLRERLANSKNRMSWSELVNNSVPRARSIQQIKENHLDVNILNVTAANATCYKFLTSNVIENKRIASLDVGDGALLIFDENGHAGISEFSEAFLAMPGVEPKLVPTGWIENHYRWIVWKLASIDRIKFNSSQLPQFLTPERVMKELKYRYDREIDKAQRPALRRILEKDDVPTRRMVLCISSIKENTNTEEVEKEKEVRAMLGLTRWKIEATDGWYDIPLTIDSAMSSYISAGKIKEGTKIITYGAELLECERGFFPLDKPTNVSLKIHTNCTRRAKWDTKLGYQKTSKPIPIKLRNIVPSGGLIGETTAVAARIYPLLYREKTPDGQSIYRNARCEEKAVIAHERALELKVDAMYAEAQKNYDSKKKSESDEDLENSQGQTMTHTRNRNLNHWERKQEEFKQKLESQVRQGLPPPRQVTPVLKVRLVDDKTTVILTIWGANEDSSYDIKEGSTITIYNCFAMGSRGGELNLTANRMTHIKKESLLKLSYPCRAVTLIPDMIGSSFEPKFCEFDTVGVVVSTGPAPYGMRNFEMVNFAYPKPNNSGSSYMAVLFWNGVSSFGYQGMFVAGSLIACSNLEWRRNTSWSIGVAYCSEKSTFTTNPRQQHLMKELRSLKALIQNPAVYAANCSEEVATELQKKLQPRSSQGTPTSWNSLHSNSTLVSPMDNFSPGSATIQRRLEKLSRYASGSPDLSPIVLNNSSSRVKKDFTPVTGRKS